MLTFLLKPFKKRFGRNGHYYRVIDRIFGVCPHNIELYKLALVHRSASVALPDGSLVNNERLEFLGDAVLESIVSDYLFIEYPEANEGFLTQMRSKLVSRATLNELCISIGLADHVISHTGANPAHKHLYGDAMEAMIGALYLDLGYDATNRLVIDRLLKRNMNIEVVTATETDFKSRLIEWCQRSRHTIRFETAMADNSSSQKPVFRAIAMIDGMEAGYGFGRSKKEAEQNAAYSVSQVLSDSAGDSLLEIIDRCEVQNGSLAVKNPARKPRAGGKSGRASGEDKSGHGSAADGKKSAKTAEIAVNSAANHAANLMEKDIVRNEAAGSDAASGSPEKKIKNAGKPVIKAANNTENKPVVKYTNEVAEKPEDKAVVKATNQPDGEPAGKAANNTIEEPAGQPANKSAARSAKQPAEQSAKQPAEQPANKPAARSAKQPAEQPANKPAARSAEQPVEQLANKPAARSAKQPAKQPTNKPAARSAKQPAKQPTNKPAARSAKQPAKQPAEQPAKQPAKRPSDKSATRSVNSTSNAD